MGGMRAQAKVRAAGEEAGIGYGRQGDLADWRIGIACRKRLDDPSLPEIAHLTTNAEGVNEVRVQFSEDLSDKDGFVRIGLVTVIRDRNGGGIASDIDFPDEPPRGRVDDGHSAFRVVGDIEQRSIRRQRAAPWLSAHLDRPHDPSLPKMDDRNGAADAIGDIREAVVRADSHAARLFANADFGNLPGDIVALVVLHPDDRDAVRLAIDDNQSLLVGGQSDGGGAAGC